MEKCKAYFQRIGLELTEDFTPSAAWLKKIQYAFCTHVPYENLDILRGVPLSLDGDALYEKIVTEHRGGFCFELNGSLGWLLRRLGYEVTDYFARYLRGEKTIPMRRHRVLRVETPEGPYLCDAGTGEVCHRESLKLQEGLIQEQYGETYRFDRDEALGWVLMDVHHGQWQPFYSFTEEPQLPIDYAAACFWCEKHPDSPFTAQEMFSLKTRQGRITLDGNVYKQFTHAGVEVKELTKEEMPWAYAQFGLKMEF